MKNILKWVLVSESGMVTGIFFAKALVRKGAIEPYSLPFLFILLVVPVIFILIWPIVITVVSLALGCERRRATPFTVTAYLVSNLFLYYVYIVEVRPTSAPSDFALKITALLVSASLLYFSVLLFRRAYRRNKFLLHAFLIILVITFAHYFQVALIRSGYDFILKNITYTFAISQPFHNMLLLKAVWLSIIWISIAFISFFGLMAEHRGWGAYTTLPVSTVLLLLFFTAVLASTSRGIEDITQTLNSFQGSDQIMIPVTSDGSLIQRKIEIGGESRNAIFLPPPGSVRFDIDVREGGELTIGMGIMEDAWNRKGDGVMFDFYVRTHAGNREKISEVYLNPKSNTADRLWRDISLNLSRWAYMQVSVEVITRGGPEEEFEDTSFDYAVISQPRYRPYKQLQRKPNVILLVVDTLRSDRLGCYGYHHKTPNIDELASEGVLFENTIATAPWTNPSVFTIHTSLYPSDLWNPMEYETAIAQSVPSEVTTLAEILRRQDYYNVVITDHPGISDDTGYLQGFDKIIKFFKMHSDRSPWGVTTEEDASKMEEITAHILEELEGGPFFLYIHLIYPHYPYAPPASYSDQFTQDRVDHPLPLIEEEKELLSSLYNGEVLLTDDYVGFLIEELMKLGLHRNTIVVFTSDHGEGFWEHGLCEHGNSLFNELLSVPLIIWGPGVSIRPGRVHTKIDLLDLMPTVLELVDVQAGHQLRGKSLVGLIEGSVEEVTTDRLCISEFQYSGDIGGRSIQDEKVKLIYNGTSGHFTAYDLKNDTAELAAGSPQVDLLHYKEKLLRHIATSAEGIVIWFEGVPETEIEALSQGGFESLKTFNFEAQEAVSRSEQAVRVRTDPLTRWQAVALYPKNGSVELRFRSGTFSDEEAGIYIGPDRIRWYEKSLLVSMDDPALRWDFLSGPRPEVWEEGKEGVWIWTSLKSRSEETALSKETLDMLRAMGYIR